MFWFIYVVLGNLGSQMLANVDKGGVNRLYCNSRGLQGGAILAVHFLSMFLMFGRQQLSGPLLLIAWPSVNSQRLPHPNSSGIVGPSSSPHAVAVQCDVEPSEREKAAGSGGNTVLQAALTMVGRNIDNRISMWHLGKPQTQPGRDILGTSLSLSGNDVVNGIAQ